MIRVTGCEFPILLSLPLLEFCKPCKLNTGHTETSRDVECNVST